MFIFKDETLKNQLDLQTSIIKDVFQIRFGMNSYVRQIMVLLPIVLEMSCSKVLEIKSNLVVEYIDLLTLRLGYIQGWTIKEEQVLHKHLCKR